MDEATSSMDMQTDQIIQKTIRSEMGNCTLITIAHRISTVMDYDKVVMMSKGRVAEYDTPANLLKQKSLFKEQYDAFVQQI